MIGVVIALVALMASIAAIELHGSRQAAAATEPPCVDATLVAEGAAALYPLDDTSGTTAGDVSGHDRTALITGAASYDTTPGPLGCATSYGALGFNGTTTHVTTPISGSTSTVAGGALTVIAWVRTSAVPTTAASIVADATPASSATGFELGITPGGTSGSFSVGASGAAHSAVWHQTLSAGTWYMYAGTYDGTTVTSYLDGTAIGTAPAAGDVVPAASAVAIGYQPAAAADYFDGQIADVAILPSALSGVQLQALYAASNGVTTTVSCADSAVLADDPAALYPLDDTSGTTAADLSGHDRTGTIAGTASYEDTPGPFGCSAEGALGFNGTTTHVTTPISGSTSAVAGGAVTVIAWVEASSFPPAGTSVVADATPAATTTGFELGITGDGTAGSFRVGVAGTGAVPSTGSGDAGWTQTLSTGIWYMYAGTYSGSEVTAYLNGTPIASAPASGDVGASADDVAIGYNPASGAGYFHGQIADVAILPSALSATQVAALYRAGAGTHTPAAWNGSPGCTSYVSSSPPTGTAGATVVIDGAGGGGGAADTGGGGSGGSGGQLTGTLGLDHTTGAVSTEVGCGGSGGSEIGASLSTESTGNAGGGSGFGPGGAGGAGTHTLVFVDGAAGGGGGGGATGLCLGTSTCTTAVAVVGGGGGGGARWDCTGTADPGAGGTGAAGASGAEASGTGDGEVTVHAGGNGTDSGTGATGGGGSGGAANAGGSGGSGLEASGGVGGYTPYGSRGGTGGSGGGTEAGTGGGGGGGGYTGGGGGGADGCTLADDASGGGGGGSSAVAAGYDPNVVSTGNGADGGGTGAGGGSGTDGGNGSISLTWDVAYVSLPTPATPTSAAGSPVSLSVVGQDSAGLPLTYAATGLPAGLSINPSTGTITGTAPTTPGTSPVTVSATDTEGATGSTSVFTWHVIHGSPAKLVYSAVPASTAAGSALSPQPVVDVEDAYGNLVTTGAGSTDVIELMLSSSTFSNGYSTVTVPASGGVARFSGLEVDEAGTYTLTAIDTTTGDTGITEATTVFSVGAAAPAKLIYHSVPATVAVGEFFAVTVWVEDTYGNLVTTGNGSNDIIDLSGTSGSGFSCISGTAMTAVAGATTFTGCSIPALPSATLTATDVTSGDTGLLPATTTVDVTPAPTSTTLHASTDPATIGTPVSYVADVSAVTSGAGMPTGTVDFEDGGTTITGCGAEPLNLGSAMCTVTYEVIAPHSITAVYSGSSTYAASVSNTITETLQGNDLTMTELTTGSNPNAYTVDMTPVTLTGNPLMRSATGSLNTIQIDDNRGTLTGWTVTAQIQGAVVNLTAPGGGPDSSIPAKDLVWDPSTGAGSSTGVTAGPAAALSSTSADTLCTAPAGHGAGYSTCQAGLLLGVPPTVAEGRYVATIEIVVS